MGYYSEVSILCGRNVARRLVELPTLFGVKIKVRQDGMFRFYWESVKWYEEYDEEIKAVMAVVNEFLQMPKKEFIQYVHDFVSIVRIGDNDDDTYYNCNYDELNEQWIKRSIDVNNDFTDMYLNDVETEFVPQYALKTMFESGEV